MMEEQGSLWRRRGKGLALGYASVFSLWVEFPFLFSSRLLVLILLHLQQSLKMVSLMLASGMNSQYRSPSYPEG